MSGTSADGIDLALVDFSDNSTKLVAHDYQPYSDQLHNEITELYTPSGNEIDRAFSLDVKLARMFADAVNQFLAKHQLSAEDIRAIGNHGQTIRHRPIGNSITDQAFTIQLTCNHTLAALTKIEVIGQFRQKDIAFGGQGAPLVPAFHQFLCQQTQHDVVIVNIGGVANISYLPSVVSKQQVTGFDTGPGNCLLDAWYQQHNVGRFDQNGQWASQGYSQPKLVEQLLQDPYFRQASPKSTGREYFNLAWLDNQLASYNRANAAQKLTPCDVQACLSELTAISISDAIKELTVHAKIYICGGGDNNQQLRKDLENQLSGFEITTINALGVNSDAIEAMAFAWLAYAYNKKIYGNMPSVTGASQSLVLGCLYSP